MNNSHFVRKIGYIVAIGVLLIPLSLVSRPASRDKSGDVADSGGQLASLRDEYQLSQSRLMEIDPASETMKLASLGLRGVAVNLLWMQAIEHKKKENYDQLASTLKALTKIQPNFVKVWEYQGHNLAYNISMEFDDYEYRYHWVKKGISFLKEGIPYNRSDHRMQEHLGFFTGMKIGRSDEKVQFRRMFREDSGFHESMADYIQPDLYDTREYKHDNWKMAYYWYDLAIKMVEDESFEQYTSDARFYMHRPAQLRNQGSSLGEEFRTDEIIQDVWASAADEWEQYGRKEIRNTFGVSITMGGVAEYLADVERLERQLDELAPEGIRDDLMKDVLERVQLSDLEKEILDIPPEDRDDEQFLIAIRANDRIAKEGNVNVKILNLIDEANEKKAKRIFDEIAKAKTRIGAVGTHDSVSNYRYWKVRNRAEADEILVLARQALYDAQEMARQSIFDDEYQYNYQTKEKKVVREGAVTLYAEAFSKFSDVFDEYPLLRSGGLAEEMVDWMRDYKGILDLAGMEWPEDFPLQAFIDARAEYGEPDGLPTTEYLEELRSGREETIDDESDDDEDSESSDDSANQQGDDDTKVDESGDGSEKSDDNKTEAGDDKSESGDKKEDDTKKDDQADV